MFSKSKRFRSPVSQTPAVGSYDVNAQAKNAGVPVFGKSKRFLQSKENLPGPCDTSVFLDDLSSCSVSSVASHFKSTPRPNSNNRAKINDLERTIENLKEELDFLKKQNLQSTAEKLKNQKIWSISQERQTQTEPIEDNHGEFENMKKSLENLKIMHKCDLEKIKADFDLEITRNMAFKSRIEVLERSHQELCNERDQVEDYNRRLQVTKGDLTRENLELSEKAGKKDEELQDVKISEEKLRLALNSKEEALEALKKEMLAFSQKCKKLEHDIQMKEEQITLTRKEIQSETDRLRCENSQLTEKLDGKQREFQVLEEEMKHSIAIAEKEIANQKSELDAMVTKHAEMTKKLESKDKDVVIIKEELKLNKDKAGKEIETLKGLLDKEVVKRKAYEEKSTLCEENLKNTIKTADSLQSLNKELENKSRQLEENIVILEKSNQDISINHKAEKSQSDELISKLQNENTELSKKLDLEIVKIKAHEEKYAKCMEHYEQNISNVSKTAEDLRSTNSELEKKVNDLEELVHEYELRLSKHDEDNTKKNEEELQRWKMKYKELQEKVEPFKEQLDAFEAEKNFLLSKHCEVQNEVSKLSDQYAKLLGHQNQKQKIHHVLKLKQENIELKTELSKLREVCEKQKRGMKHQDKMSADRKKFNPLEAFTLNRKSEQ